MKARELVNLGIPKGPAMKVALAAIEEAMSDGRSVMEVRKTIKDLMGQPALFTEHPLWGPLAHAVAGTSAARSTFVAREQPAPWRQWGEGFEAEALQQMKRACELPVSVAGALMPDAHVGYGLPIGGVLATRNAVVPFGVGMDIACRMKLTVLDLPVNALQGQHDRLVNALEQETSFGVGAFFSRRRQHPVMDEDWSVSKVTMHLKDKAWDQLGTSGSGNHFVEFGTLTFDRDDLGMKAGVYLALLSHSGSRGAGGTVAEHFSKLATELHPELPKELSRLAWLTLDSAEGQEYWAAMELMGRYAAANHALIHRHVARHMGVEVLLDIENHHNFAWKEIHNGEEVVVHRKGATPAGPGVVGIIPGSMGTPGYVVRGLGNAASLHSASHGAGRKMSRQKAKDSFTWNQARKFLEEHHVELLSAGLDEVPMAYKDIDSVMTAQVELVQPVARFDPRLVKMAPAGEKPED